VQTATIQALTATATRTPTPTTATPTPTAATPTPVPEEQTFHASLTLTGLTSGVVANGRIEAGSCSTLTNCLEMSVTGSFTVGGTITGLPTGLVPTLAIPVVTPPGTAVNVVTLSCQPSHPTGGSLCLTGVSTPGTQPQPGGLIVVTGNAPGGPTPTPATPGVLPTPTGGGIPPVVPLGVNVPASSGQPGVPCTLLVGTGCPVTGGVTGNTNKISSMVYRLTATGPATAAVGGIPAAFIPTTARVESAACGPVSAALQVTCSGTTAGDALLGATVTVRFPLVGGGTADVTGVVQGPGPLPLLPPPPPPILPPLPPAPPPFLSPPLPAAVPSEVPVIPEADSVLLLTVSLGVVALLRGLRRRGPPG